MAGEVSVYAAQRREVLGKKVKRLRREGILPANVYGRGLESIAVQMPARDARAMMIEHGTDTLIELRLDGESEGRPVVVRSVQRDVLSGAIRHIDFWQVDLERTIQARVPMHIVGEAPAVHVYQGVLLQELDAILVEALPTVLPEEFLLSVEGLEELDSRLTVAELTIPDGVLVLTEPGTTLARIARPRLITEEEEEVPEGEEALAEGEEGEEGEEVEAAAEEEQE